MLYYFSICCFDKDMKRHLLMKPFHKLFHFLGKQQVNVVFSVGP